MRNPRNCKDFKYYKYEMRVGQTVFVCFRADVPSGTYVVGRSKQKGRPLYKTILVGQFEIPLLPLATKGVDWDQLPVGARAALTKIVPDFTY